MFRLQIDPADHARDPRILIGQLQQKLGFLQRIMCLYQDRRADAVFAQQRFQIGWDIITMQTVWRGWHPLIREAAHVPEMLMAVDNKRRLCRTAVTHSDSAAHALSL